MKTDLETLTAILEKAKIEDTEKVILTAAANADPRNGVPPTLFGWQNVPVAISFGIGESF